MCSSDLSLSLLPLPSWLLKGPLQFPHLTHSTPYNNTLNPAESDVSNSSQTSRSSKYINNLPFLLFLLPQTPCPLDLPCLFITPKILTTLTTAHVAPTPRSPAFLFFLSCLSLPVSRLLYPHSLFGYNVCVACVDVVGRIRCVPCDHGTGETVYA